MRVLTLTPFYPDGSDDGAGCFVAEPIRALEDLGVECCVVAVQPFYRSRSQTRSAGASWVRYGPIPGGLGLASAGAFLYARLVAKIRAWHRSNAIDLIHAHAALPCGHAAARLSRELKIPFVVTVHGRDAFFTKQVEGYAGRWCQRVAQFVYRSAACVVCISHKVAEEVAKGATCPVNTTVIYNGVDERMFSPAQSDAGPRILSVGNLIPIKGHELLLRAFAAVHKEYPALSCEIVGEGPERSRLSELTRDLKISGRVHLSGRKSRMAIAETMQNCTLFALPSRYEGLGCVYLEAMAAEKPVIACRGQGIEEVIEHGRNGWLVDPDDLEGLTAVLHGLMRTPELGRATGRAARHTIVQKFTLAQQAGRLADLYRRCAA